MDKVRLQTEYKGKKIALKYVIADEAFTPLLWQTVDGLTVLRQCVTTLGVHYCVVTARVCFSNCFIILLTGALTADHVQVRIT